MIFPARVSGAHLTRTRHRVTIPLTCSYGRDSRTAAMVSSVLCPTEAGKRFLRVGGPYHNSSKTDGKLPPNNARNLGHWARICHWVLISNRPCCVLGPPSQTAHEIGGCLAGGMERSAMRRPAKLARPGRGVPLTGGSSALVHARHAATVGPLQSGRSPDGPRDLSTPDTFRPPSRQRPGNDGAEP